MSWYNGSTRSWMGWERSCNNFRPGFCYPHDNRTSLGLIKGRWKAKTEVSNKTETMYLQGKERLGKVHLTAYGANKKADLCLDSREKGEKKYLLRTGTRGLLSHGAEVHNYSIYDSWVFQKLQRKKKRKENIKSQGTEWRIHLTLEKYNFTRT